MIHQRKISLTENGVVKGFYSENRFRVGFPIVFTTENKAKDANCINTSYLTDSYIGFTLKMESVSKNTIFGLKMMVKSGLEKFILKSLHAGR